MSYNNLITTFNQTYQAHKHRIQYYKPSATLSIFLDKKSKSPHIHDRWIKWAITEILKYTEKETNKTSYQCVISIYNKNICAKCALTNNLEILKWLKENNFEWSASVTFKNTCFTGNIEMKDFILNYKKKKLTLRQEFMKQPDKDIYMLLNI